MARTLAPLASLSARGSIKKTLTFSSIRGRGYAKRLRRPTDPASPRQLGRRAWFTFLTKSWQYVSPTDVALWEAEMRSTDPNPKAAYMRWNLAQIMDEQPPSMKPSIDTTTSWGSGDTYYIYGKVHHLQLGFDFLAPTDAWAWIFTLDNTANQDWALQYIRVIQNVMDPLPTTLDHGPLAPGYWYTKTYYLAKYGEVWGPYNPLIKLVTDK